MKICYIPIPCSEVGKNPEHKYPEIDWEGMISYDDGILDYNFTMGRRKLTKEKFIETSNKLHHNKYDYSLVDYVTTNERTTIICPKHGKFKIYVHSHLEGYGCSKCDPEEAFIKKANKIYKNRFDYSKIKYNRSVDKVKIICSVHGSFWRTPSYHLAGTGCPKCGH
jgi:hypothetical protein